MAEPCGKGGSRWRRRRICWGRCRTARWGVSSICRAMRWCAMWCRMCCWPGVGWCMCRRGLDHRRHGSGQHNRKLSQSGHMQLQRICRRLAMVSSVPASSANAGTPWQQYFRKGIAPPNRRNARAEVARNRCGVLVWMVVHNPPWRQHAGVRNKRSGEEAGIPTTPGGLTLAASRPATKLSSCQRGPTRIQDPFRCRLAANSLCMSQSASLHHAGRTWRRSEIVRRNLRPGGKIQLEDIT